MRLAAASLLAAALIACSSQAASQPSPSATSAAQSPAADLRVHLDLLLGEQVMIIAKESAAAVNHTAEYAAYTSLLAANSAELTNLMARAYGNTAAGRFAQVWTSQNGFLVDYAIGVVTHNDDKAKAAMTSLNTTFTPQLAQLIENLTHFDYSVVVRLMNKQFALDKAFIDALFAGDFTTSYLQLNNAYSWSDRFGDVLAEDIAVEFPDTFPGDPSALAVDTRLTLNEVLQQHAYLATMATDAAVNGRAGDKAGAMVALATNTTSLRSAIADQRVALAWSREYGALLDYAVKGDAASRSALTGSLVVELAGVTKAGSSAIAQHETASIKVVDDQRAKSGSVADDDRAAATAMQAIADSIS